jgi:pyridoxine 5-phosphate synthase
LRQARATAYPDVLEAARRCVAAGAHGITVHLREDRRHIQDRDVDGLKRALSVPLNLEMAVHPEIVGIALDVKPEECCLVPERRQELTTEGGLDAAGGPETVGEAVSRLKEAGIRVSLFIDPDLEQVRAAAALGAPVVELHTGTFCEAGDPGAARRELDRLVSAARAAHGLGLTVNAGHGLNTRNVGGLLEVPHLDTLNIGHSIVARAVMIGLEPAVREMLACMAVYTGGRRD